MANANVVTEKDVQDAIDIILADKARYTTSLNWAVDYCRHGKNLTGYPLENQCAYILSNITSWRHPQAREVRRVLRTFKCK